jgi:xylose isomerase
MFWLVKFLEDVGYDGPRHFDAHAYRTEDLNGVKDFARGCMRTYLILKEKAQRWNRDHEIQNLLSEINGHAVGHVGKYSSKNAELLLNKSFDRAQLSQKGLGYEKLDQLTMDVLLGVR